MARWSVEEDLPACALRCPRADDRSTARRAIGTSATVKRPASRPPGRGLCAGCAAGPSRAADRGAGIVATLPRLGLGAGRFRGARQPNLRRWSAAASVLAGLGCTPTLGRGVFMGRAASPPQVAERQVDARGALRPAPPSRDRPRPATGHLATPAQRRYARSERGGRSRRSDGARGRPSRGSARPRRGPAPAGHGAEPARAGEPPSGCRAFPRRRAPLRPEGRRPRLGGRGAAGVGWPAPDRRGETGRP